MSWDRGGEHKLLGLLCQMNPSELCPVGRVATLMALSSSDTPGRPFRTGFIHHKESRVARLNICRLLCWSKHRCSPSRRPRPEAGLRRPGWKPFDRATSRQLPPSCPLHTSVPEGKLLLLSQQVRGLCKPQRWNHSLKRQNCPLPGQLSSGDGTVSVRRAAGHTP